MKTIYKTLLIGMVYLLSNTTYAQIIQYSDDGTKGCIDCEEKSANIEFGCFCLGIFQLKFFNYYIPVDNTQNEWLRGQERLLADAIEEPGLPYDNFNIIQKPYFRISETNVAAISYYSNLENRFLEDSKWDDAHAFDVQVNSKVLAIRSESGTPVNAEYGDLKLNGKYLRDMTNEEVLTELINNTNALNEEREKYKIFYKLNGVLKRWIKSEKIENYLADRYIDHYNSLGYEDAIRFMTRYIAAMNQGDISALQTPFGNSSNIFSIQDHDYSDAFRSAIAFEADIDPVEDPYFTNLTAEEALLGLAMRSFEHEEKRFVTNRPKVKKALGEYLGMLRYKEKALSFSKDIMNSFTYNKDFPHDKYNYKIPYLENRYGIYFQADYDKNLAFELRSARIESTEKLNGLHNILHSISISPNFSKELVGQFYLELLQDNDVNIMGKLTALEAYSLFEFRTTEYVPRSRKFNIPVSFRNTIGETLWQNGLSFPSLLEIPYAIEGALALARGETFDFAFRKKVYDLRIALQLNSAQENWLIGNRGKTENIYNYYSDLNEAGAWSNQEVLFVTNAINVLMVDSSANPLLGADCRSFEYALPPGALQRGCAVKNFDHRFYTAGIRPNGSPYFGTIEVPVDTIYFAMPNWMTNGQAANNTAVAVTAAIKIADVYFFNNPDASEFTVADVFRDALKAELTIVGGSFSLTVEPFPIPSPAPYITSVLGISNPFDCDR